MHPANSGLGPGRNGEAAAFRGLLADAGESRRHPSPGASGGETESITIRFATVRRAYADA